MFAVRVLSATMALANAQANEDTFDNLIVTSNAMLSSGPQVRGAKADDLPDASSQLEQTRAGVEVSEHVQENGETAEYSLRKQQHKRHHKPKLVDIDTEKSSSTSASQIRLSEDSNVPEGERLPGTMGARMNRVLVDAFSGAGVHSIHADPSLNRELAARLSTQDVAVGIMLLVFYFLTVTFGWVVVYRMASNQSSVKFFCDPDENPAAMGAGAVNLPPGTNTAAGPLLVTNNKLDEFVKTFCRQPPSIQLSIAGFREENLDSPLGLSGALTKWGGKFWSTRFNVGLVISAWAPEQGAISPRDRIKLEEFLKTENSIARLTIQKQVSWGAFGQIQERIKRSIREKGFTGPIDIRLEGHEELTVYQNNTWSNFWHNRTTKILVVLSVFGPIFYYPMMWLRGKKQTITSDFKIQISAEEYWNMIESRISSHGFASSRNLQTIIAEHGS